MTTEIITRLSSDIGFPKGVVHQMWCAARSETNKRYSGKPVAKQTLDEHTLALFSVSFEESYSVSLPQWFIDLAKAAKISYVKANPAGKIAKAFKGTGVGIKRVVKNTPRVAHIHYRRAKAGMRKALAKHGSGLSAIKNLLLGKRLSEDEKAHAKDTAKVAATILLGGLAAAGLFLGLGPFVHVIGNEFLSHLSGGVSTSSEPADVAGEVLDKMYAWVSKDPEQLTDFLKAKYGDEPSFEE